MSDFLQQMARHSAARAACIGRTFTAAELDRPCPPLGLHGFDLIAEIKDRSPAAGELAQGDRAQRARQYAAGGAAAISVLTEPSRFAGSMEHLREVVAAQPLPVMCKDFLVDPQQVLEARAAGASGVLLIAAMLTDAQLASLLDVACEQQMFVLLESFDATDLKRSAKLLRAEKYRQRAAARQLLCGVNSRNLRSLAVEPERLRTLAPLLPDGVAGVAESGLLDSGDVAAAASAGYALALVGTALMRSEQPQELLGEMLRAGRRQVAA